MTDDTDTILKGHAASAELQLTEAAFDGIREGLINKLLTTTIAESLLRDKLVMTIQALDLVRENLMKIVQDGNNAKAIAAHVEQLTQALD